MAETNTEETIDVEKLLDSPIFFDFLHKEIDEYRKTWRDRPAPPPGQRYRRGWQERMAEAGEFCFDFFQANALEVLSKKSKLSAEKRNVINVVVVSALGNTINKIMEDKTKLAANEKLRFEKWKSKNKLEKIGVRWYCWPDPEKEQVIFAENDEELWQIYLSQTTKK